MISDFDYQIIEAMQRYGGSFAQALGVAMSRADMFNFARLKKAFPEYWEDYKIFINKNDNDNSSKSRS